MVCKPPRERTGSLSLGIFPEAPLQRFVDLPFLRINAEMQFAKTPIVT
jgi:hypothetical protein